MDPDDLYGLPLDQFIPERGALAKALRTDGKRDAAAEVAKLRKPSVAAWAVNQVVRTQGKAVRGLYDAGDALRKAQTDLLAGKGDARALRKATDRERKAVDELVDAARGLLTSDGHELSPAIIERVSETLNAAALDEAAREQVRAGTLERELRHVGFGLGDGELALAPPARPRAAAKEKSKAQKPKAKKAPAREAAGEAKREKQGKRDREAERKQAAARRAERKKARDGETAARRRLERAQQALQAAEERHERAAAAFAKADEAMAAARAEAESALAEHEQAKSRVEAVSTD